MGMQICYPYIGFFKIFKNNTLLLVLFFVLTGDAFVKQCQNRRF